MNKLGIAVVGTMTLWPLACLPQSNPAVTVSVDATADLHPINPLIYGVAWASAADLNALNAPLNRGGGTPASTYSWKANAQNLSDDWYFESYPQTGPGGALYDDLIADSRDAGAQPMVTIPLLSWVAKLGANRAVLPSFSVKKYGAQCSVDPYDTDAGDGLKPDCVTHLTGNSPNDAYVQDSLANEQAWVQHLVSKWHGAAKNGVAYYIMDNESSIWFGDHWDVHPIGPHATEIRDDVIKSSAMIKALDPAALVVGPEEYGWFGYEFSGFDQQWLAANDFNTAAAPDRTTVMGKMLYIPWLLKEWKAAQGKPIDVLSVHFYPGGSEYGDDNSTATQLLRNRSTRQFWDPTYSPPYWPNTPIALIPLLKTWVSKYYYPGTPVAVTEYNWGDEDHINGATAQADIDGIFGRQALDMATRWTVPAAGAPAYKAMQMYRNYDGHHSTFGDTGVATTAPTPDDLSAFGAIRTLDGALTVMLVNKDLSGTTPVTVKLAHFAGAGLAHAYQLTAANAITPLADLTVTGNALKLTLPAPSITLLIVSAQGRASLVPPTAIVEATPAAPYAPPPPAPFTYPATFTGKGSKAAGGASIVSYSWDFGDGTGASGASPPTHSYSIYGVFPVTLTVKDSNGLVSAGTAGVAVEPQPQPGVSCGVGYDVTNDYGASFLANLTVTNAGKQTIDNWVLTWNWPSGQTLVDLWNATATQTESTVSAIAASWDATIKPGANVVPGLYADYSGTNQAPTEFRLNGTVCKAS